MCQFATPDCGYACRAIRLVREHSRGPVGLDARAYLIRVERRLMQFHCSAPLGIPVEAPPHREAAE
ncbi:hypothetical protein [Azospirillum isscasi]|uniref:Uncharacterized protein n=1 Tax=Azospirillum isscasi TaxID=3053926 RepID=A0ABU0WEI1_9PROT|nr:hypothetical protein [Azospirillum isscasi]MDQ2102551.1 hypothetical protein [Azospirillum isscasi]